jgi:hypothetical protein
MRISLLMVALVPILLFAATPSLSEPIFILNCRLINVHDHLFRQHCKAQERECGGKSCFARAKRKTKTVRTTVLPAPAGVTPVAAVQSTPETSSNSGSTDNSASPPMDGQDDQSGTGEGGDSLGTSKEDGPTDGSAASGADVEGGATSSQSDGTDVEGGTAAGSGSDGAEGNDGTASASNGSDNS